MSNTPTHVEAWGAIPRDLDISDRSRSRGAMTKDERDAAERVTQLGRGLSQVTYVDSLSPPAEPGA